jgi:ppGpp synthetase/RelA/SpoT-type nucleotidyltranferase
VAVELSQEALAAAYGKERNELVQFAEYLETRLAEQIRQRAINAEVKSRAKDTLSFVIKALLGRRYEDPMNEIGDKVGARIVLTYWRDREEAVDAVNKVAKVIRREEKKDALAYNENGYQGIHLEVEARAVADDEDSKRFAGKIAEIQIRTRAQAAWAEVSHDQLYKPAADVPDELKRRIYRLVALIEIFDDEVEAFLQEAHETPGFNEAAALKPLQEEIVRLGAVDLPNRSLTRRLAPGLLELYGSDDPDQVVEQVRTWSSSDQEQALRVLFEEAQTLTPETINPLVPQPEVLLILERLTNDTLNLEQAWSSEVPRLWLERLAEAFGMPVGEAGREEPA